MREVESEYELLEMVKALEEEGVESTEHIVFSLEQERGWFVLIVVVVLRLAKQFCGKGEAGQSAPTAALAS